MVDAVEKSTDAVRVAIWEKEDETVFLDSRLALFHEKEKWLAVSDLHYGYEITRRTRGGLWPLWGRETVENRIAELLQDYEPKTLILNGDIVDSAAAGSSGAIEWLGSLEEKCESVILIQGNHDRGTVLQKFDFVRKFETGSFVFHHGHLPLENDQKERLEIVGHIHPSFRFRDGAGLSMKLPCLVQEKEKWIMPAVSPWAGGVKYESTKLVNRWVCAPKRIIPEIPESSIER